VNAAPVAAGTCSACSAGLATGQRYCLACGERRGELPFAFRPPERAPQPVLAASPVAALLGGRRSFGAVGAVALASGVLIGAAVGPALTPASFASTARRLVLVATDPAAVAAGVSQPAGGAAVGSSSLAAPTGNVAAPARQVVDTGASTAATAPVGPASAPAAPAAPDPAQPAPDPTPTPPADEATVAGTVVHISHEGHGYAVATKEGQLIALHAAHAPDLGDVLKTTVRPLENGTFQERTPKSKGHVDSAKFHGTVTYADADSRVYTVSARGVSLLVRMAPTPAEPAADPATAPPSEPPAVGTLTTVDVAFRAADSATGAPAHLEEVTREDGDPAAGEIDLEAVVREPGADPTQLVVSADDAGESPATLLLRVPPEVDVSGLPPGTVIAATVKREADGSLTLVTATDDSDRKAADR
jgi:hypothetical protein